MQMTTWLTDNTNKQITPARFSHNKTPCFPTKSRCVRREKLAPVGINNEQVFVLNMALQSEVPRDGLQSLRLREAQGQ